MKSALAPFLVAIALTLAGGGLWMAGRIETRLADVHKQMATLQYADAQSGGGSVEASMSLERRVPVIGKAAENDARDVRASAGYWRADYAAIAPKKDANGVITETDPGILLLTANGAFRASQAGGDRLDTIRRLDNVVKGYAEVLKAQSAACNGDRSCEARGMDAAFNYEFAIRTRDMLAKMRGPASAKTPAKTAVKADETDLPLGPTLHGRPGAPPAAVDMNQFKIVIPKRGEERKDAPDAGKGGQKIRKG